MLLCESALKFYRFLWEAAPIDTTLDSYYKLPFFPPELHKTSTHNIFEILTSKQTQSDKDIEATSMTDIKPQV